MSSTYEASRAERQKTLKDEPLLGGLNGLFAFTPVGLASDGSISPAADLHFRRWAKSLLLLRRASRLPILNPLAEVYSAAGVAFAAVMLKQARMWRSSVLSAPPGPRDARDPRPPDPILSSPHPPLSAPTSPSFSAVAAAAARSLFPIPSPAVIS